MHELLPLLLLLPFFDLLVCIQTQRYRDHVRKADYQSHASVQEDYQEALLILGGGSKV